MQQEICPINWLATANKIIGAAWEAFRHRRAGDVAVPPEVKRPDGGAPPYPWTADATPVELYERLEKTFGEHHRLITGIWRTLLDPLAMAEHRLREQHPEYAPSHPIPIPDATLASIEAEAYDDLRRYREQGDAIFHPPDEALPNNVTYRLRTLWQLYSHRDQHELINPHHIWYVLAHPYTAAALEKYLKEPHLVEPLAQPQLPTK